MFVNNYEIMELAKIREEEIGRELEMLLLLGKLKDSKSHVKRPSRFLAQIGKFFSTVGDSLQSQYDSDYEKVMRKVS